MMDFSPRLALLILCPFLAFQVNAQLPQRALPRAHALRTMRSPLRLRSPHRTPAVVRKTHCRAGVETLDGWKSLDLFFKNYPYLSAFMITGFKGGFADRITQFYEAQQAGTGKYKPFNFLRNLAFITYAGAYQGCFQHFMFNECFPIWFGVGSDPQTVIEKVAFDLFVLTPLLCLPVAYLVKAVLFKGPRGRSLQWGLMKYGDDVTNSGLLWKYWRLWGPVNCLTFSVVPVQRRIAFIAVVSFFWMIILSTVMSKEKEKPQSIVIEADEQYEAHVDNAVSLKSSKSSIVNVSAPVLAAAQGASVRRLREQVHVQERPHGFLSTLGRHAKSRINKAWVNYSKLELLNELLVDIAPQLVNVTISSVSTRVPDLSISI